MRRVANGYGGYEFMSDDTKQQHTTKRLIMLGLLLAAMLFACSKPGTPALTATPDPAVRLQQAIAIIASDMGQPHEGRPHGVPSSYNWASRPRLGMGNDPGTFTAITAWGQVYEDAQGNSATNTRVQLRQLRALILSIQTGRWHIVQSGERLQGAAYREDFVGDVHRPAAIRSEPDGGISVTAGGGYNFHFWPADGRVAIDPRDIGGIVISMQARLVLDDQTRPDDRQQARYLLSVGGDYWASSNAQWDNLRTNGDIGIGRFKYVTGDWQMFSMSTLSLAELQKTPPPITIADSR